MKVYFLLGSLILLSLVLSACGDAVPGTTATTTTTLETTTSTAEVTQSNNRPLCVGLFNLGSCNVVTVQTQTIHGRTAGAQAPAQPGMTGAQLVGTLVLLCLAFVFVVGIAGAVMGLGGYN